MRSLPPIISDSMGRVPDSALQSLADAMPGTRRLILPIHGWLATLQNAEGWIARLLTGIAPFYGDDTLAVGLHWQSDISDAGGVIDLLGEFTYWQMESRARLIGQTAGYAIVHTAISESHNPIEIHCIGHSFGGIVATNTLAQIGSGALLAGDSYALTLIQGALPANYLESGQPGGPIQRLFPRVKITRSDWDLDLKLGYPIGEGLELHRAPAIGSAGPSASTIAAFRNRLSVLDLSPQRATHTSAVDLPQTFQFIASGETDPPAAELRRAA